MKTRTLTIEDIQVGTKIRAIWNGGIHEILKVEKHIVTYDDKSGFKSLSNNDGLFRDTIEVVIREFKLITD